MSDFSKLNGYDVKDAQARSDLSDLTSSVNDLTSSVNDLGNDVSGLTNIVSDTTNPIYYGADPTGVEDSTTAINDCIEANKGGTINFTIGKYKITDQIELPYNMNDKVSINGNGSTIIASGTFDTVFKCGVNNTDGQYNNVSYTSHIKDLIIDCENATVTYAFDVAKGFKDLKIINVKTYRTQNGIRIGESTGSPADVLIDQCLFYGIGSEFEGVGIISNCTDNYVSNTRIYGFRTGILANGYLTGNNIHVLLRWSEQTTPNFDPIERNTEEFNSVYKLTSFAIINDHCKFYGCYADSTYKFLDILSNINFTVLTNSFYFNSRDNVDSMIIDLHENTPCLICTNNVFKISKNNSGIVINRRNTLDNHSQIKLCNNTIQGITNLTDPFDLIMSDNFNYRLSKTLTDNTWYVIGLLSNVSNNTNATFKIYINSWVYYFRISDNEGTVDGIYQIANSETSSDYTVGILSEGDNKYICIKSNGTKNYMKLDIKLESASNMCFLIPSPTVPGSHPIESNSLLSSFTNDSPEIQKNLKTTLMNN